MGGGRKTETILVTESSKHETSSYNSQSIARNLRKADLGGVVFGCKNTTISECLTMKLFGLPAPHFSYIRNVEPGLPLFLFNYSDRMLHGVYEADGFGQMNINSHAWTDSGHGKTSFPAQVSIRIKNYCQPIAEKLFQPIIKENYYTTSHFYFELDKKQVKGLTLLFRPSTLQHKIGFSPRTKHLKIGSTNEAKPTEATKSKSWAELFAKNMHASHKEDCNPNQNLSSKNSFKCYVKKAITTGENDENREVMSDWEGLSDEKHQNPTYHYASSTTDFVHNTEDSSSDYKQHTSSDDELSQQLSELEFPGDDLNSETERVLNKLKNMVSYAPMAPCEEACTDILPVCSTINMTDLDGQLKNGPDQESLTKSDSLHQNIELMQVVKELSARIIVLEKEMVENKMEVEHFRTTLKVSEKNYQEMQERIRELETKVDPSISLIRNSLNHSKVDVHLGSEMLIYFIGGHNGNTWLDTLDSYSISLDILTPLKRMSHSRSYAAATSLNGNILVFGGCSATENLWYKTVECYNPRINEWILYPSMQREKGSLAGVTLYEKAFAIGGGDGSECFSDVEMFDPMLGRWIHAQYLLEKRFALTACENNGAIYVVGGFDGNYYLNSAERYDPREPTCTRLPSMKTRRASHSMTVLNEKLYVMGGCDSERTLSSTEVFDPRAGSWYETDHMNNVRGYAAAAVLGDSLYVIGGVNDMETTEDTVECYQEGKGWALTGLKAAGKRSFSSVVVI